MVTASKASFELILSHIMIFMTNQLVFWIFEELEETFVYFLRVEDTLIIDVVSAAERIIFHNPWCDLYQVLLKIVANSAKVLKWLETLVTSV